MTAPVRTTDGIFTWAWKDGFLIAQTILPVPLHEYRRLKSALTVLQNRNPKPAGMAGGQVVATLHGTGILEIREPDQPYPWFSPVWDAPDESTMKWSGLVMALWEIQQTAVCIANGQDAWSKVHRPCVHGGIDFRSLGCDGTVRGHCLEYIAASVRDVRSECGVLIGDPRFEAPELFAGEYPTEASDVFAAAAVFCARNRLGTLDSLPTGAATGAHLLPKHRVGGADERYSKRERSWLLSLLDDDPQARLWAAASLTGVQPIVVGNGSGQGNG